MSRAPLTFDGFGINGPDVYRTRLATFTQNCLSNGQAQEYGPLFAAAPELLAVCEAFLDRLGPNGYFPGAGFPMTERMRAAVAKARGES